jgi:hypothetical protein
MTIPPWLRCLLENGIELSEQAVTVVARWRAESSEEFRDKRARHIGSVWKLLMLIEYPIDRLCDNVNNPFGRTRRRLRKDTESIAKRRHH